MPHYYDKEQDGPLKPFKIPVTLHHRKLELWSGSGVFSKSELDEGTRLLIERSTLHENGEVLDLGCGIGVVGIAVKQACPRCRVTCSDVSERAVEFTRMNAKELHLDLNIVQSDGFAGLQQQFDAILFNPPYVAGRQVIFRLFDEAFEHLTEGGTLQVVARHAKGGEMLKKRLLELFGNCDDSAKSKGYRLYKCRKVSLV